MCSVAPVAEAMPQPARKPRERKRRREVVRDSESDGDEGKHTGQAPKTSVERAADAKVAEARWLEAIMHLTLGINSQYCFLVVCIASKSWRRQVSVLVISQEFDMISTKGLECIYPSESLRWLLVATGSRGAVGGKGAGCGGQGAKKREAGKAGRQRQRRGSQGLIQTLLHVTGVAPHSSCILSLGGFDVYDQMSGMVLYLLQGHAVSAAAHGGDRNNISPVDSFHRISI